jgi:hypothetical protein
MTVKELIRKLEGLQCDDWKIIAHCYPDWEGPDFLAEIESLELDENHNQIIIELDLPS